MPMRRWTPWSRPSEHEAYALGYRGTRRALIRRFPYGVIYLPVPEQNSIVVLAVLHCGRDPKLWRQRSKP